MPGPPTIAEVVDLVVRLEDDPQRRNLLDSFPSEFFRIAAAEGVADANGMFAFAQVVGEAVNQGLLAYRREHAGSHLGPQGAPWTEREFQARSGYHSTLAGQQMAALFRERRFGRQLSAPPVTPGGAYRDVFISHANEDKAAIARPLAMALRQRGISVWFDEYELVLGDSLREKIDEGLLYSRIGVVILSPSFFAKRWPRRELDGLTARQMAGEANVIVPIWHDVGEAEVRSFSPPLAGLYAARSSLGLVVIADEIERVLNRICAAAGGDDSSRDIPGLSGARTTDDPGLG